MPSRVSSQNYDRIGPTAWGVARDRTFTDIPYSQEIFAAIQKIERETGEKIAADLFPPEKFSPVIEARYKLVSRLLRKSGSSQVLELASGLSPRGISTAPELASYVEMDLPPVMAQKRAILQTFMKDLPGNLRLEDGNALEPADLQRITPRFDRRRQIAVVHEGLLRYLNFDEKARVAANVRTLLGTFGGVWITPDITLKHALDKKEIADTKGAIGIDVNENAFESTDQAKEFFTGLGFSAEVHPFIEVEAELVSPARLGLSSEHARRIIGERPVFVMCLAGQP